MGAEERRRKWLALVEQARRVKQTLLKGGMANDAGA